MHRAGAGPVRDANPSEHSGGGSGILRVVTARSDFHNIDATVLDGLRNGFVMGRPGT
jgi:hypothetical protein